MAKLHVKLGDTVLVIAGKDKGKIGKILLVNPSDNTVIVEGVNIIHKHQKAKSAQDKSAIVKKEGKINVSNVQMIDPVTKRATRVYSKMVDGKKVRVSKDGNVLDRVFGSKKTVKKSDKKAEVAEEKVKTETKSAPKTKVETDKVKTTKTTATKTTTAKTTTAKTTATKTASTSKTAKTSKTTPRVRNQER